jgi:hypothetical protein
MTHLAAFLRGGQPQHVVWMWARLGKEVKAVFAADGADPLSKRWVSTSGLGVSWLHLRIDSAPKYYNYVPYKS